MNTMILFRQDQSNRSELEIAQRYFPVVDSRLDCSNSKLVIGRYSVLPFYHELAADLKKLNTRLINSHSEHQYVANFDYYYDVEDLTAKTWFQPSDVPQDSGPWVLKGRTNSRKFQWKELMYASSWEELMRIYLRLMDDPLTQTQGIVIRKFLNLEIVSESLAGPPFANEWRFFAYKGKLLSKGFYWSSSEVFGEMDPAGLKFAQAVALRIKDNISFSAIDIARQSDGRWVLIELNDGQMAGLSENDPDELYSNLKLALTP